MMGADHVDRITRRINGARVAVVNDYVADRANEVAGAVPGARVAADPLDAIASGDVDAVLLATPGPVHEKQLLACLEHRKPVLCEKPLTTAADSSLGVVRRESELQTPLIQVGFMRRFDPDYIQLKARIDSGELGQPLVMHCVHRTEAAPPSFDSAMIVKDCWCTRSTRPDTCSVRRSCRFRSCGRGPAPTRRRVCRTHRSRSCRPQVVDMLNVR